MTNKTMGETISTLRKEKGMTQKELAEQLNITDKAVSKWERDLACPDISTLPKLAEIFGVSVDELLKNNTTSQPAGHKGARYALRTALKAVPLALGIAIVEIALFDKLDIKDAVIMIGIAITCLSLYLINYHD